jgi:hypothetical protein
MILFKGENGSVPWLLLSLYSTIQVAVKIFCRVSPHDRITRRYASYARFRLPGLLIY